MQPSAPYRPPLLRRPSTAGNANATPGRCPFLGTPADPGTSLAFPSEANHCFRSSFPVPISSIHQESYCLSAQYAACPVYRQYEDRENDGALVPLTSVVAVGAAAAGMAAAPRPVPAEAVPAPAGGAPAFALDEPVYPDFPIDPGPDPATSGRTRRASSGGVNGRAVLAGLLLLALLVLAGWAWLNFLNNRSGERQAAIGTVVTLPTLEATGEPNDAALGAVAVGVAAEETATALAETVTREPEAIATNDETTATGQDDADEIAAGIAATATALFAGASATAECGAPDWWALYVVQPSDTIEGLAAMRGILPEEVIVANCLPAPDLSPGQELYLPPVGVIVLLPGLATPIPTVASVSATVPPGLPTRPSIVFPTPTFPGIIIIPTTQAPVEETLEPPRVSPPDEEPPVAPTSVRPTSAAPTPVRPTNTPPAPPTVQATRTPPGGGTATRTPPGSSPATLTPPSPLP